MRLTDSFAVVNSVVEVALADITTADVNVIVNSMCDHLHVGTGVSGAILRATGPTVAQQLIDRLTPVEAGSILVTSAGQLPYRYIFHAISSRCGEGTSVHILKECTQTALNLARDKKIKSVAFPALGTGEMGFDMQEAAITMIDTVVRDCKTKGGIERILFCLLRPDAFTTFFREAVKASVREQTSHLTRQFNEETDSPLDEGHSLLSQLGGCQPGKNGWSHFEEQATQLFKFLFVPPLSPPRIQSRNESGLNIRDAVFPNATEGGFWRLLDHRYTARLIPLECKNYVKPVGQESVNQLSRYLRGKALGKVGFLASRCEPSSHAKKARSEVFRDLDQIIVFLSDFDFSQLIEMKRLTKRPEDYLQRKIDDFSLEY